MNWQLIRSLVLPAILTLGPLNSCAEIAPPRVAVVIVAPLKAADMVVNEVPQLAGARYQVYFDNNSAQINERAQMIVDTVAHVVAYNNTTRVTVIGKANWVRNRAANLELSQFRAARIRGALIAAGVPSSRIDTSWSGEAKQEVVTANGISEQRNQIVYITVIQ